MTYWQSRPQELNLGDSGRKFVTTFAHVLSRSARVAAAVSIVRRTVDYVNCYYKVARAWPRLSTFLAPVPCYVHGRLGAKFCTRSWSPYRVNLWTVDARDLGTAVDDNLRQRTRAHCSLLSVQLSTSLFIRHLKSHFVILYKVSGSVWRSVEYSSGRS